MIPYGDGFDDNYGYNLWRQFDKCTPIAEFAPQDAWMHPSKNFAPSTDKVYPRSTNDPWGNS